jgi:glycosyltransferase involved in cell wall biosynthesis
MNFLILTQYYPPETGAPQNRLQSLAHQLVRNGNDVSILTAMPNYPKMKIFQNYRGKIYCRECIDNIEVFRSYVFISNKKSTLSRLMTYFSFVISSYYYGRRLSESDYIICESPPLFLGITGVFLSKKLKAKLIFNVSDLWPESVEKLGVVRNHKLLKIAYKLESWIYRKSNLVTCQTKGIEKSINSRFPNVDTYWLPNGTDIDVYHKVVSNESWKDKHNLRGKKVFMYAGIIGFAQGLEVIVKAASILKDSHDIAFVIVGDGPEREVLMNLNQSINAGVLFISNIPKKTLLAMMSTVYACIVPLKKIELFKGAVPSKIFDPLSLEVPILLGVQGEAYELFIKKGKCGISFIPEDYQDLSRAAMRLCQNLNLKRELGENGKRYVEENYNRKDIADNFLKTLN